MNPATLLLNAYYERLYEILQTNRPAVSADIEKYLAEELSQLSDDLDSEKLNALNEVSLALLEERIELYNPIGFQYTFDRLRSRQALQLELQLDWFDSRQEFEDLIKAVQTGAQENMTAEQITKFTDELIKECGAFPDKTIIETYRQAPALNRLPDYIVSSAVEKLIQQTLH